jgi:Fe-S oxidoreductase
MAAACTCRAIRVAAAPSTSTPASATRRAPLVERNLAAFPQSLDAIVVDSAGCGSSMKEYGHWMPEAGAFAAQVRDFSEWLVELGPRPARSPCGDA